MTWRFSVHFPWHPNEVANPGAHPRSPEWSSRTLSERGVCPPRYSPQLFKKVVRKKGVNKQISSFSSQDENILTNSIYKNHTNRYLTNTLHSRLKMRGELPSGGARADVHEIDKCVDS